MYVHGSLCCWRSASAETTRYHSGMELHPMHSSGQRASRHSKFAAIDGVYCMTPPFAKNNGLYVGFLTEMRASYRPTRAGARKLALHMLEFTSLSDRIDVLAKSILGNFVYHQD